MRQGRLPPMYIKSSKPSSVTREHKEAPFRNASPFVIQPELPQWCYKERSDDLAIENMRFFFGAAKGLVS